MGPPLQVGKYEVVDLIGRGGMGVIYKARDNVLGRFVALKIMTNDLPAEAEARFRFLREARAVSMLQHPNIVVVYELGEHNGSPFIAMEFLDGEPLTSVIRRTTPLSVLQKSEIILQVAKALQYAHSKGVVHRDIKPGNIMYLSDGTVKVVDFGIAYLTDQRITRTGLVIGTLEYLAPEQLNGEVVDGRADVFSLGVVLYELLSGTLPFEGANMTETVGKILLSPARPLSADCIANSHELQTITDKALAKRKEERFQTCAELGEALTRFHRGLEEQARATTPQDRRSGSSTIGRTGNLAIPICSAQQSVAAAGAARSSKLTPTPATGGSRRKWVLALFTAVAAAGFLYPWMTRSRDSSNAPVSGSVTLTPITAEVAVGGEIDISATVHGTSDTELIWRVMEGDSGGRVITRDSPKGDGSLQVVYIAPKTAGKYHVVVSTKAEPHRSAIAEVTVTKPSSTSSKSPRGKEPKSDSPFEVR